MSGRSVVRVRSLWGLLLGLVAALALPGLAFADPAGPTDYLSEIRSVEPATPSIELAVLGGDSFVELDVELGTEVIVLGYQSEDYLWFRPDGTVLENQNAPSTYTNDERFGGVLPPANATVDAEPDWSQVASDGRYSWHDHRAHWMQTIRPAGKQVGDQIVEGVIPLIVNGNDVDVTVISTWKPEPSPLPSIAGGVASLAAVLAAGFAWRAGRRWVVVALPVAAFAFASGVWQFTSLPSETGPRLVWWVLPAIAIVAAIVGVVAEVRSSTFVARSAALIAGVQLAIWGFVKRDGLTAALIPTDAPGWFDRLSTAAALAGGVGLAVVALLALFTRPGASTA
ncbi:MAG: hypothetical protein AB8G14_03000 [Ilumatobacter sp.]